MKLFLFLLFSFCMISCSVRTVHTWEEINPNKLNAFWVTEILSGDRIRLSDGIVVQYLGIQAPPKGSPYFEISSQANARLLGFASPHQTNMHHRVVLKFPNPRPDQNGIYHAYVYNPIKFDPEKGIFLRFINEALLELGYATININEPEHEYYQDFVKSQELAKQKKSGLWEFQHK